MTRPTDFRLVDADESHLPAIQAILSDVMANTTAIYDDGPMSADDITEWFGAKRAAGFPVLVAVDEAGQAVAFATYGVFNKKPGYRHTVEHTLHVDAAYRRRGLGRMLLDAIEDRAREAGVHAMVGLIDAENTGSRHLHDLAGYQHAGVLREVGWKFGRWLDVVYYQKLLRR